MVIVCLLWFYVLATSTVIFAMHHLDVAQRTVCLLLYVLATSKVISGQLPTCECVHSVRLYSVAPRGSQAVGTVTRYPTQSYYPDVERTSPCPTLEIPIARVGSDRYQF